MQHFRTILIFLLLTGKHLTFAQPRVELYISSNDCIKCTAAMSQVLRFCSKNHIANFHIYTDFKSNKIRLLRDFPELQDSLITCDRDLIQNKVPDSRSIMVFINAGQAPVTMLLTQLDLPSLLLNQPIFADKHWSIPDSLLERGNYTPTIQGDRVILMQGQLQEALYIQLLPERAVTRRWSMTATRPEYEAVRTLLKHKKQIPTLPYDSALTLNQQVRLPMQTTDAIQIDQDTLRLFRSFYFYIPENGGDLANRGFVFAQQIWIDKQLFPQPQYATLLEPRWLPDSVLVAPMLSFPHQSLGQGRYFAYYNLYNDPDNRFKLSNRYLGCIYTPGPNGWNIQENLRLGAVSAPDSQQIAFRKLLYGNSPAYFFYQGKHYVLLKFEAEVLDVSKGKISSFSDFLKEIAPKADFQEISVMYAIQSREGRMDWVYQIKKRPGLFYSRLTPEGRVSSWPLDYRGSIDAVSIQEERILVLIKNEPLNQVEIQAFPLPK